MTGFLSVEDSPELSPPPDFGVFAAELPATASEAPITSELMVEASVAVSVTSPVVVVTGRVLSLPVMYASTVLDTSLCAPAPAPANTPVNPPPLAPAPAPASASASIVGLTVSSEWLLPALLTSNVIGTDVGSVASVFRLASWILSPASLMT